jgi:putative ABC transport system substrate-binding protein
MWSTTASAVPTTIETVPAAARSGGLISYRPDTTDLFRRAASYVDRLLRGAKVNALPVGFPTRFQIGVNLKSAFRFK